MTDLAEISSMATSPPSRARVLARAAADVEPYFRPARLLRGNLFDAEQLVEVALREASAARAAADAERAAAREEADQLRESARECGRAEGRAELARLIKRLSAEFHESHSRLADLIVEAAFEVARNVLESELRTTPGAFIALVRSVLSQAMPYAGLTIVTRTEHADAVNAAQGELAQLAGCADELRVRTDDSLAPFAVIVETEMGAFVGGLTAELARMRGESAV